MAKHVKAPSSYTNKTNKGKQQTNPLHKWQQILINVVKKKLNNENITIAKADKSKAIVIIHKKNLQEIITNFYKLKHTTHHQRHYR